MKRWRLSMELVTLATLMSIPSVKSAEAGRDPMSARPRQILSEFAGDVQGRTAMYAAVVSEFRMLASDRPESDELIDFFFDPQQTNSWRQLVRGDLQLSKMTQADFFTGSIMLSGSSNAKSGIVGLYNPWWDAILLLAMRCVDVHPVFTTEAPAVLITDFRFVSGETFRGEGEEANPAGVRRTTVVPEADPISAEIWRVTAKTVKRFEEVLPLEGTGMRKLSFARCGMGVANPNKELEARRIAVRAGLRLKLSLELLRNAQAFGIGLHVQKMARDGSLFQLYSYFREPESRKLLPQFSELPSEFRKDFVLYGYVPTKEATLYVLVNKKFSRLYVTASVPADVPKTPASFEWYDLDRADEMLELWNNRVEKK